MNLTLKMPLAFSGVLAALMGAALVGIYSLNQAITICDAEVEAHHAHERAIGELLVTFKTQVEEWKDTLLRGKDPARLDKHWTAFAAQESEVDVRARILLGALPAGESRQLVEQFVASHAGMGQGYRKGFDAFKSAGFAPGAGDAAVVGIEREPARLLAESGRKIAADSAAASTRATVAAHDATVLGFLLMMAVGAGGIGVGAWLSRGIAQSVGDSRELARSMAAGELAGVAI